MTNTAEWTTDVKDPSGHHFQGGTLQDKMTSKKEDNILYHNEPMDPKDPSKGRKFVKVPDPGDLKGRGWVGDAVAFDYDGDGLMDVYVTSMFGRSQLYHNKGGGKFEDVTIKTLGKTPYGGMGCTVFDYTNNGQLSILVMDMHSDMWMGFDPWHQSEEEATRTQHKKFSSSYGPPAETNPDLKKQEDELGVLVGYNREELIFGNALFRNDGKGKFEEVSDKAGMETFWPWGMTTGDFLNNGREDVFITAGMGYPFWYWPNALMMNNGDGTFTDRAKRWASNRRPAARCWGRSTTKKRFAPRAVRRQPTLRATAGWRLL